MRWTESAAVEFESAGSAAGSVPAGSAAGSAADGPVAAAPGPALPASARPAAASAPAGSVVEFESAGAAVFVVPGQKRRAAQAARPQRGRNRSGSSC